MIGPLLRSSGFTLIEIMIVLAIIVGVLTIAAPKMFSTASAMRTAIRKLAITSREVRNNARMYNMTTRLVLDMKKEGAHSYWVESANGEVTLLSEEQQKELDRLTELQREGEAPKNEFKPETRVVRNPVSLPKSLYFESVETSSSSEAVKEGKAYIHFFAKGFSEDAAIHITDRKTLNWTIVVNPLTGRADVFERNISLKEVRGK
ncbi:MAG: prepilin-type N-terminal cleavage/methylation domain-containing protein [Bdellovibrionota bacterium]